MKRRSWRDWFCCKKEAAPATRFIGLNASKAGQGELPKYKNNTITTARYTALNFLPKNLFEQFRRIANFYFLIVACIHLSIDSPVSPMTSVLPLLFVIITTGIKQGVEDWKRHREDKKVNHASTRVIRDGRLQDVRNCDVAVGDVIKVLHDEEFPCDLLLLSSSDPEPSCSVTTANLDGETNLKKFHSPDATQDLGSVHQLWGLEATLQCQHPNSNLYKYEGLLNVRSGATIRASLRASKRSLKSAASATSRDGIISLSLSTENLLLKGTRLRNTDHIFGCAVYTGADTKMMLNSKIKSNKFSTVEKSMNNFLIIFLIVLAIEVAICSSLKYILYPPEKINTMWYIDQPTNDTTIYAMDVYQDTFSFLIILCYIIPISLYVTLEMQKFLGTYFFEWDSDLRCGNDGESAKCNTSDLNEDLGQVEYLFTDKTGTLTENSMYFRECSIVGNKYRETKNGLCIVDEENVNDEQATLNERMETFLMCLALCHNVQVTSQRLSTSTITEPKIDSGQAEFKSLVYHSSSPDEKALVEAAARFGVVLKAQEGNRIVLDVFGKERRYTQLQMLEFDADRKRMSVIVREEPYKGGSVDKGVHQETLWLITKGAETSVLPRIFGNEDSNKAIVSSILRHITDYAQAGLRTLVISRRKISKPEYKKMVKNILEARQVLENRDSAVQSMMDEIEKDLELVGATGVEDLLQEGVNITFHALRQAGIKVWVLTGDKIETAVSIAHSCGHFNPSTTIIYLTGLSDQQQTLTKLQNIESQMIGRMNYGLVVDGIALISIIKHFPQEFYKIASKCHAVTCCRMSPKQKAQVVRLVKHQPSRPMCAAIGDGANDVSMIQEAHVGIGIMGKEGRQAVQCADFAFSQFRFLQKALLVHGHWYYIRVATFVHYNFYKNVVFNTPIFLYTIWSAFSTQSVYDSLALTFFNISMTTLPIMAYGIFEQCLPSSMLLQQPHLYKEISKNAKMGWKEFVRWNGLGVYHTLILYFGVVAVCWGDTAGLPNGQIVDLTVFGMTLVSICVCIVNFKIVVETRFFCGIFNWSVLLTLLSYAVLYLFYSGIILDPVLQNYSLYWTYYRTFECPSLLLAGVLIVIVALIPDMIFRAIDDIKHSQNVTHSNKVTSPIKLKSYSYINEDFVEDESERRKTITEDSSVA